MTLPLATLMDVLDRADAHATHETEHRDQLFQAAQALNTAHAPHVLIAAIEAHLTQQASTVRSTSLQHYDFGWARPRNEADHQARLSRGWRAWLGQRSGGREFSRIALHVGWITTALGTLGSFWSGPTLNALSGEVLLSAMGGGVLAVLADGWVDRCAQQRDRHEVCLLNEHELQTFMTHPATRTYLKAVLVSGVPRVLNQDRLRLQEVLAAHQEAERQRKRTAALKHLNEQQTLRLAELVHESVT